jgi:hypothetical protein
MVVFSGRVASRDGVGELYRLVLDGGMAAGRQWQTLLPRDVWGRYDVGIWSRSVRGAVHGGVDDGRLTMQPATR